ncbi:HAD-IA family hydrolase [Histidinibacterium lentulum]|uniref:HAD family phosphatase n=1 Tax=Histidinibacterium lentulum TaxID=2480588 RepID=A0A3N2R5R1_9RHOB|nr:HAD-IA family hydrolase [Histidinibacterium lentulum]ROU02774.1 HAD family phosphatase [Histidinibacterium lentulum]
MTAPKAVVFDIGNVLFHWAPEAFYDRVLGPAESARLFAEVPLLAMNERVDNGAPLDEEIAALVRAHPDWHEAIATWQTRWIDLTGPVIDRSVRLLRALRRKGVPVYALSNFGRETFVISESHYPFLEEFDHRVISAHHAAMKPGARIYEILETETGQPPEALLFTDDKAENVAAAAARGWHIHHFDGPGGLASRLVAAGLLTEAEAA